MVLKSEFNFMFQNLHGFSWILLLVFPSVETGEPRFQDNGVHASAGPLEALRERMVPKRERVYVGVTMVLHVGKQD